MAWLTVTVSGDVARVGSTVPSHTAAAGASGGGIAEHRTWKTVTTASHGLVCVTDAGCRCGSEK